MTFAEIILPLAVQSNYTYKIKPEDVAEAAAGKRVLVNFGKSKIYTGIIKRLFTEIPDNVKDTTKMKYVESIIDEHPIVFDVQFKTLEWMAYYYMCTEGEVLKAALPIGLKPKSNWFVRFAEEDFDWQDILTDDKEYLLFEAIATAGELNVSEVDELWAMQNPMPRLKKIEEKGWIRLYQKMEEGYKAKMKTYLNLHPDYQDQNRLEEALNSLSRAPQQENVLMHIVSYHLQGQLVGKSELLKQMNVSTAVISTLVEKGFIKEEQIAVDRLPEKAENQKATHHITLNPAQDIAIAEIRESFSAHHTKPVLLHGITGSGKTHIYIKLIQEMLKTGKQVLYLLPEITITQQIIDRVRRELGSRVGVYHSRFNDNERVEIWQKVCNKQYDVVIGVRSAVFLPFENLGLIIIDEEHDRSFKQDTPSPRYNARDIAIWLGYTYKFPVLLGSATPSFETFFHAKSGKYTLVSLKERAIAAQIPQIATIDMRKEMKEKSTKGLFSSTLFQAVQETLSKKEQVILFQNRRGYSPYLICMHCGHVPECVNCDISLTYHKYKDYARCHYCGHTEYLQEKCPSCGNFTLKKQGAGTERIEEEVKEYFPDAVVERMDLDTTRGKTKFQRLIARLEAKEIDILVGTQMVSKGLDFENVTLVGVVNADTLLSYPDFRVQEHAYQMLTQVSGRAGRSTKLGRVLIQTLQPGNMVLTSLQGDYEAFYEATVHQREELMYPPYTRLIRMEIQHPQQIFIEAEALRLNMLLKPIFGEHLLGPDYAPVARVRNVYRMHFLFKLTKNFSLQKVRTAILNAINQYYQAAPNKTVRILIDVDPM